MSHSITSPRARANQYREKCAEESSPQAAKQPRSEQAWSDLITQRIEEAMAAGAFDNLPGKGKPVSVAPEPFVPAEMQMANSLLKNNGLSPAWISERKDVLAAIAAIRSQIASAKTAYGRMLDNTQDAKKRAQLESAWLSQVERWRQEIVHLNRRIELYNLTQPIAHLEIFKLDLKTELP